MSNGRNTNPFWRNLATGIVVAATGAFVGYVLNEVLTSNNERPYDARERRRRRSSTSSQSSELRSNTTTRNGTQRGSQNVDAGFVSNSSDLREDIDEERNARIRPIWHLSPRYGSSELRKNLIEKLITDSYVCNVCLEEISRETETVSCRTCFTIYHKNCITGYHLSQMGTATERTNCPTCRSSISIKLEYTCFCGKIVNPVQTDGVIPHSCGMVCGIGACPVLCHPGPCQNPFVI